MNCSESEIHTESKEDDTLMRYSNRSFRMPGLQRSTRSTPCAENIDQTCSFIDNVVLGTQNVVDAPVSGQIPSDSESSAYNSDSSDSDTDDIQIEDALRKHKFRWRSIKPPVPNFKVSHSVYHQTILKICHCMIFSVSFGLMI